MPLSKRIWRNVFAGGGTAASLSEPTSAISKLQESQMGRYFIKTGPCRTRQYGYDAVACTLYF